MSRLVGQQTTGGKGIDHVQAANDYAKCWRDLVLFEAVAARGVPVVMVLHLNAAVALSVSSVHSWHGELAGVVQVSPHLLGLTILLLVGCLQMLLRGALLTALIVLEAPALLLTVGTLVLE